ncbi:hypothetical protein EC968_008327 [Mortierella alpina]|nr:hypothetical protein EC968_008327 [Mortierella alpina]
MGENMFDPNVSRSSVTRRSEDRGTVIIPGRYDLQKIGGTVLTGAMHSDLASLVRVYTPDGRGCYIADLSHDQVVPSQSGLTSPLMTAVTKCLYATGEIIALSSTSVRFSVPNLQSFRQVASSIFLQQDDLLLGMEQSISEGLFSKLAPDVLDGIHIMEVKVIGTEVRSLTCAARRASHNGTTYLMCSYTTAAAVLTKPQSMLPDISARRAGKPYMPYGLYTVDIIAEHLPLTQNSRLGQPRYSMSSVLNASIEAARYFASLGQNVNVDWMDRKIIFIFQTADPVKGYEIPLWLVATVIASMVGSLALVLVVEFSLEDKFKRSLHWMVSKELEPSKTPKLRTF